MSAGVNSALSAGSQDSALHETNPQIKPSSRRMRIFLRSKETRLCLVVLAVLIVLVAIPMSVWPAATTQPDLRSRFLPPTWQSSDLRFLFGADSLGRSIFYRVLAGARLTLFISGTATLLATVVGVVLGVVAGYYRGTSDMLISRVIDIMLAFPSLLLVLALVSSFGQSTWALIIVLGISGCAAYARVIRSSTLQLSQMEFVEASRSIGATNPAILIRHLLPNLVTPIVVLSTVYLASFLLAESAISFLGLGPAPPDFTWGGMIGDGRGNINDAWWATVFPGLAIVITVMTLGFIGDAIRDAFDPKSVAR